MLPHSRSERFASHGNVQKSVTRIGTYVPTCAIVIVQVSFSELCWRSPIGAPVA